MGKIGWKDFVVWQCSIRQRNFRLHKGKPSEGLICNLYEKKNNIEIKKFISVLLEKKVEDSSRMFEFMYKRTHDPEDRYLKAVKLFSDEYFNQPDKFDGRFTATFSKDDPYLKILNSKKSFQAQFFERETGFDFPLKVQKLAKTKNEWKFTFWHNFLFNPSLNENVEIFLFSPDKSGLKSIA